MNGLELLKKHHVEFNTLTCVNRVNSYKPLAVYNFLKSIGSTFRQFIPIVERKTDITGQTKLELVSPDFSGEADVTDWSMEKNSGFPNLDIG
jgi:uncharacterized protein